MYKHKQKLAAFFIFANAAVIETGATILPKNTTDEGLTMGAEGTKNIVSEEMRGTGLADRKSSDMMGQKNHEQVFNAPNNADELIEAIKEQMWGIENINVVFDKTRTDEKLNADSQALLLLVIDQVKKKDIGDWKGMSEEIYEQAIGRLVTKLKKDGYEQNGIRIDSDYNNDDYTRVIWNLASQPQETRSKYVNAFNLGGFLDYNAKDLEGLDNEKYSLMDILNPAIYDICKNGKFGSLGLLTSGNNLNQPINYQTIEIFTERLQKQILEKIPVTHTELIRLLTMPPTKGDNENIKERVPFWQLFHGNAKVANFLMAIASASTGFLDFSNPWISDKDVLRAYPFFKSYAENQVANFFGLGRATHFYLLMAGIREKVVQNSKMEVSFYSLKYGIEHTSEKMVKALKGKTKISGIMENAEHATFIEKATKSIIAFIEDKFIKQPTIFSKILTNFCNNMMVIAGVQKIQQSLTLQRPRLKPIRNESSLNGGGGTSYSEGNQTMSNMSGARKRRKARKLRTAKQNTKRRGKNKKRKARRAKN